MSITIYIEGGGDSKELHARCREGFRRLLERSGFSGRMPRLVACGGRDSTFEDFRQAHSNRKSGGFIAMLVDSEDPIGDIERVWNHLHQRDGWRKPTGGADEQALLMTTCMETWIVCDRAALRSHYGSQLQENALPSLVDLEGRNRHVIQRSLATATKACSNSYTKGKRSFEILSKLDPVTLKFSLPSFSRVLRILKKNS